MSVLSVSSLVDIRSCCWSICGEKRLILFLIHCITLNFNTIVIMFNLRYVAFIVIRTEEEEAENRGGQYLKAGICCMGYMQPNCWLAVFVIFKIVKISKCNTILFF